ASSRARTRRKQGGAEIPTRRASSTLVIRPSVSRFRNMRRSIRSSLIRRIRSPLPRTADHRRRPECAQFCCAKLSSACCSRVVFVNEHMALSSVAAIDAVSPVTWVLHDGKAGMASQALGLAEATGFSFVEKRLSVRRPWAWLPPQLWLAPLRAANEGEVRLAPPWPDLVIGCGRHSAMPALAIRRASGGRTFAAQVQDPRVGRGGFALLFVPEHDRFRVPRGVVTRCAIDR